MLCFVKKLNLNAFYFNLFSFFKFVFSCFLKKYLLKYLLRFIRGDVTFIDPVNKYCILAELIDHLHHHRNDGFLCIYITQTTFNLDSIVPALLSDT